MVDKPFFFFLVASPILVSKGGPSNRHCSHTKEDGQETDESNYLAVADKGIVLDSIYLNVILQ